MQEFPKTYEDVLTSKRVTKNCDLDNVGFNGEISKTEYLNTFKKTVKEYQIIMFDQWVKIYWLMVNFSYKDIVKKTMLRTNRYNDAVFSIFCRNYINFNQRLLTNNIYFNKIATYFSDFFPDYINGNPFNEVYEYPFEFMTFDCLLLVYQIPDRLELLKLGEERKMSYPEFTDYIYNHVLCLNEELGTKDYSIISTSNTPPYIKYENYANNKNFRKRRRKKT